MSFNLNLGGYGIVQYNVGGKKPVNGKEQRTQEDGRNQLDGGSSNVPTGNPPAGNPPAGNADEGFKYLKDVDFNKFTR